MLQIVIWMLCVYLVLKAVELWLIASATPDERRTTSRTIALLAGAAAVMAAMFFFYLSLEQVDQGSALANSILY